MISLQQAQDPSSLDALRDLVEPEAVSFLPLAPGWWVIGGVTLALTVFALRAALRSYRRQAYRRAALAELATLKDGDLAALPALLKRTALGAFPREQVASLSGEDWLQFLDSSAGTTEFTSGHGREVLTLAYTESPLTAAKREALLAAAKTWISRHKQGKAAC